MTIPLDEYNQGPYNCASLTVREEYLAYAQDCITKGEPVDSFLKWRDAREDQIALSKKYGMEVRMVLPLDSGRFAVFDAQRRLIEIVGRDQLVQAILDVPVPVTVSRPAAPSIDLSQIPVLSADEDVDLGDLNIADIKIDF